MKHAEVLAIPVGSKVVISERTSSLVHANLGNSIVATLETHDNYGDPFWSGIYWRDESDTHEVWTPVSSSIRSKRYHVSTTQTNDDGTVTKLKTLIEGKHILGVYDSATQQVWDDQVKAQEEHDREQARVQSILQEVRQRGDREAQMKTTSVRNTVESLLGRAFDPTDRKVYINISHDSHQWRDEERTIADPTLSGSVTLDYALFEELVEKMYAQLDAR